MQLEKLQLNLRPRSNQQALDLGFTLLRLDPWNVYWSWLALILPLALVLTVLSYFYPQHAIWWYLILWWPLPMLERAPLYVLARLVFGEKVAWKQALQAWPSQLKGGIIGMLTIGRFNTARGLYHAIWQLEGARGRTASERKRLLARNDTSSAAFWYGVVCSYFTNILAIGIIAMVGIFMSDSMVNPFALFFGADSNPEKLALTSCISFIAYSVGVAMVGPIFVACSFTLYLNRRATLEAWDLEIALRQIKPPHLARAAKVVASFLLASILAYGMQPNLSHAANPVKDPHLDKCEPPKYYKHITEERAPAHDAQQQQVRDRLQKVMAENDLLPYRCVEAMRWPISKDEKKNNKSTRSNTDFGALGEIIKTLLIAALVCILAWFLYSFRHKIASLFQRGERPVGATEVGGLDIRPESLPPDVAGRVRQMWQEGERRGALGLLYRATLSRLVQQDALHLPVGATEGDCLNAASAACAAEQLTRERLSITRLCTELWRDAAYGERWPESEQVFQQCSAWQSEFGNAEFKGA